MGVPDRRSAASLTGCACGAPRLYRRRGSTHRSIAEASRRQSAASPGKSGPETIVSVLRMWWPSIAGRPKVGFRPVRAAVGGSDGGSIRVRRRRSRPGTSPPATRTRAGHAPGEPAGAAVESQGFVRGSVDRGVTRAARAELPCILTESGDHRAPASRRALVGAPTRRGWVATPQGTRRRADRLGAPGENGHSSPDRDRHARAAACRPGAASASRATDPGTSPTIC